MNPKPVLLHIPHASTYIPPEYRGHYLISPEALRAEMLRLTDLYTDALYDVDWAERVVFGVSRFLVDAERFADDAQESMAARGMGALYTATTDLAPLRPAPDEKLRAELLGRFYWPHHNALNAWADAALAAYGKCLLLDCHSFPSQALPYEMETDPRPRPEICIGTDSFHTPEALAEALCEGFRKRGYEVGRDSPFAGALTPGAHWGKSKGVMAAMIELRKDLYMDERTGTPKPAFHKLKADIAVVMEEARRAAGF